MHSSKYPLSSVLTLPLSVEECVRGGKMVERMIGLSPRDKNMPKYLP